MMLKNISFGVYVPGNSLMHRLQARTKILLLVMCVAWVFTADTRRWHFAPFIAITVCAFASLLLAGISPREIWRRVWLLVLLLALGIVPLLLSAANDRTNKVLFAL
ncbi:MAG: hypothetical protein J2P36_31295, partial [Ktedonobacteraceae bacterium]|nr:hypothetical protein [Ktedonobacteraceae bacterium]